MLLSEDVSSKWRRVFIADSLSPLVLKFADSLNGYCFGVKPLSLSVTKSYGYRTSDGGRTWHQMDFSGIAVDSFVNYPIERNYMYDNLPLSFSPTDFFTLSSKKALLPFHKFFYPNHNSNTHFLMTDDGGVHWRVFKPDSTFLFGTDRLVAQFQSNEIMKLRHNIITGEWESNDGSSFAIAKVKTSMGLYVSYDTGITFPYRRFDPTLYTSICDTSNNLIQPNSIGYRLIFDWSDPFHLLTIYSDMDTSNGNHINGFRTLTSTNGGATWTRLFTPSGSDQFQFNGYVQCIKQSTNAYIHRTTDGRFPIEYGRFIPSDLPGNYPSNLENYYKNTPSFFYSTDYGHNWQPVNAFEGAPNRAFEAIQFGDVWMTITLSSNHYDNRYPADRIVHTTDNGITWTIDDTTLRYFEQPLDGTIMTFSDPRHGWLAAQTLDCNKTFIYYYEPDELSYVASQPYTENYGVHYTLYPNPASATATLDLYKYFTMKDILAYNILGAEVPLRYHIEGSKVVIDVRNLPVGHYTLRIRHNWGISVIPLVVMR
jgi:photosystem II stability/assembly factor-like uncharacterized protein